MLPFDQIKNLFAELDVDAGAIRGVQPTSRRLSDMRGLYADHSAFEEGVARDDPVIYSVASIEPAQGEGQLHYGLGVLYPGRVGDEYYMTKGHLHAWRPAAEVYLGLRGNGVMLLESELTGESRMVPLGENQVVYVPGYTAHRTVNIGETPLVYIGVYDALAGHDYGAIADRNFRQVVVRVDNQPVLMDRSTYLARMR